MASDHPITTLERRRFELVYHYTTLVTAIERILPNGRFQMSPFARMRDPRESGQWTVFGGFYGELDRDRAEAAMFEGAASINALKNTFKVMSLTLDVADDEPGERFGRGFARPRLWEQYGGKHVGVCMCFDKDLLVETMRAVLEPLGRFDCGPVEYRDAQILAAARSIEVREAAEQGTERFIENLLDQHLHELFFTKLTDWQSEHEYRLVVRTADDKPVTVSVGEALTGVVLGEAVALEYLPSLRALCEQRDIDMVRLRWDSGRPMLIPT